MSNNKYEVNFIGEKKLPDNIKKIIQDGKINGTHFAEDNNLFLKDNQTIIADIAKELKNE